MNPNWHYALCIMNYELIMTYDFLQHYWWFIVSLLGALLVFMMFVQGANSVLFSLSGKNEDELRLITNSTGKKWEITFTTLVTFGGAFFASFPLFYSTSFGGAYWVWMIILFTFVLQAVSYEFQHKLGNILGARTFQWFLVINGIVGPLLLGMAVATFFNGANFIVEKANILGEASPIISRWANASHGLDALLNGWNWIFGLAVFFLARILGILYVINNVDNDNIRSRGTVRLVGNFVPFHVFFIVAVVYILLKDGYAFDPATGEIYIEPDKYFNNFCQMWPLAITLLAGVALFLFGCMKTIFSPTYTRGIWPAGIGAVLAVLSLLLCAGWNYTAYYPSVADLQSSLTIANSCSSEFTLTVMFYVSLLVPFVVGYIAYVWRKMDRKELRVKS